MTKRIFHSICLVALVVFISSLIIIVGVLYSYFSKQQMKSLKVATTLCASAVEQDGIEYLEASSNEDFRITWIAADGKVIYDNRIQVATMENHLQREEIREAIASGYGESSRRSSSLMEKQLYCARKLSDGTILRLSTSHMTPWSLILSMIQPIILVIVIALGLSLYLAYRLSKHIVKPLNELNLDNPNIDSIEYEEITPLVTRIKNQQQLLHLQKKELEKKQREFDTATKHMNEGIILLSESGSILSINQSAADLLGISQYCVGKDLLLFNSSSEIQELIRIAREGNRSEQFITLKNRNYQINSSPIISEDKVSGIAVVVLDITEKEKAEEARREFTANVSHELKTPLQNISGRAELLANGLVQPNDCPRFAEQILSESKRMIALIEDIIKLSHLDEGAESMQYQAVDLYELSAITIHNLSNVAQSANVSLTLSGEHTDMIGIPELLSGIIYNLCDNAIKYNHEGGSVAVEVSSNASEVILNVKDTGIGIPPDAQERIFERFYRVDKSRSKSVGGTGLGLSIVKHSVKLHNGEIKIHSIVDEGTTITVTLPKGEPKK